MEQTIKVSIIIPVYNQQDYIRRCIDSVILQTYKNLEILLIDDGSTDESASILDLLVKEDKRVKVMHQNNQGLAMTRQNGLKNSTGDYIFFLDSDDYIKADTIEKMVLEATSGNADVVSCVYTRVYEDGREVKPFKSFGRIECSSKEQSVYEMHVTRRLLSSACGKLIRRELLLGVSFPKDLAIGEEHDMVAQLVVSADKIVLLGEGLYYYFLNGKGISRSGYNRKYYNSLLNYIRIKEELIKEFPKMRSHIAGYYDEYEMAVITAMCRNKQYDKEAISRLQSDLKEDRKDLWSCKESPLFMRLCGLMISVSPKLFFILFRPFTVLTGR